MKIQSRVVTQALPRPYSEIKILCEKFCTLECDGAKATFVMYWIPPDELEAAGKHLLDLAHALRTELAAYEERKGQAPQPEEVQP
jgi:hypothetical protein